MKLDELKKLCEEATPGPWDFRHGSPDGFDHWELWNPETGEFVVQDDSGVEPSKENLAFIAAARSALPKLIAEIETLQDLVKMRGVAVEHLQERNGKLIEAMKALKSLLCEEGMRERVACYVMGVELIERLQALESE